MISLLKSNEWEKSKVSGFYVRELMNLKTGTVKRIKVESQSYYPIHNHHNTTEYALVLSGTPEIEIDEKIYCCGQGDFVIFPAGVPHAIRNKGVSPCKLFVGSIHLEEHE